MAKILKIEIEGTIIQKSTAAKTYLDAFNLLYKKGLINESILSDFNFVKENKSDFAKDQLVDTELIVGSKNLWISTYSGTELKRSRINKVFKKYKINGTAVSIEKSAQNSPNVIENGKINEVPTAEKIVDLTEKKADNKKPVDNILKQALCIIGDSGVGKSVRIKRTLEKEGHEKLIVIMDSLWSHLLFDYIPESRKYELTKIGEFIREANSNKHKHYTIVIDECHKNLEIVNDSLLQAISTERNEGKRFLSLHTLGDEKFNFLPKEDGNRMLPDNLGFVFISSKKDIIIEGNPDLKNRVEIIELTKDDWQNESYSIAYLLEKIKKEEQSEYTN